MYVYTQIGVYIGSKWHNMLESTSCCMHKIKRGGNAEGRQLCLETPQPRLIEVLTIPNRFVARRAHISRGGPLSFEAGLCI